MLKSTINRITLRNFRNYEYLDFSPQAENTVIVGNNGVGKTNILEAISFMVPGKGLRGCRLQDVDTNYLTPKIPWRVEGVVEGYQGRSHIITGRAGDEESSRRFVEVDSSSSASAQSELARILAVSWVVPQMDQVFITGTSIRRKLLDRIVSGFETEHAKRLATYDYYLKERNNLLKTNYYDSDWMKIIEDNIAKAAVIIAASRVQTLEIIQETINDSRHHFPKALLELEGGLEQKINQIPAIQIEEEFKETLHHNRQLDFMTKRTNAGIHRSDLLVYSVEKNIKAEMCSTGEQKLLLISIFLAEIFAQMQWKNRIPILLLDDVGAHLDKKKRQLLCSIIHGIGAQSFISSTDKGMFDFMKNSVEFVKVEDNQIRAIKKLVI